jgi:hypothetical protein
MTVTRQVSTRRRNQVMAGAWREALTKSLTDYTSDTVSRGTALTAIACKLIERALAGELDAIAMIADRLDGKASSHVQIDASVTTADLTGSLTDIELTQMHQVLMAAQRRSALIDVTPDPETGVDAG